MNIIPLHIPVFTQKHYEYMIEGLRKEAAIYERIIAAEILCRVFKQDNPKFKPAMFMAQVMED